MCQVLAVGSARKVPISTQLLNMARWAPSSAFHSEPRSNPILGKQMFKWKAKPGVPRAGAQVRVGPADSRCRGWSPGDREAGEGAARSPHRLGRGPPVAQDQTTQLT